MGKCFRINLGSLKFHSVLFKLGIYTAVVDLTDLIEVITY